MPSTIDHALRWWASEDPARMLLSFAGDSLSYAAADRWVGRLAAHFVASGLDHGDRVVIVAENSLAWCMTVLATIRAGGLSVGISTRSVSDEIAYLLESYQPRIVVRDASAAFTIDEKSSIVTIDIETVERLRTGGEEDVTRILQEESAVAIITTSGSTARPKGVVFTHRSIIESNAWQVLSDPLRAPYARLIVAPMNTSAGMFPFLHCMLSGGSGYLEAKFEAEVALRLIIDHRINVVTGAPIFFQRMADLPGFADADLRHVQCANTGGATVMQPLLEKWSAKGVLLRQMYGLTECGGTGVVNSPKYALSHSDKCGGAGMFTDVAIIDKAGNHLAVGEEGEIILRGPGYMKCYWNNPEETAKTLVDGWLHTGDAGLLDELGLLRMTGRLKDIIISGGLNISAAEVERVILEFPGIDEVAVIAARDERFGEVPFAIIHGPDAPDNATLVSYCESKLSKFKVPRYVLRTTECLPRLPTGKISKPALRAIHGGDAPLPHPVR